MTDVSEALNDLFSVPNTQLSEDVERELSSILRLHSISPQELFYKWESYSIKMGGDIRLDIKTARDLRKDIQEVLERESREKTARGQEKKKVAQTPRGATNSGDVYGMLGGLVSNTPRPSANGSTIKRKSNFETPAPKASKNRSGTSPRRSNVPFPMNGVHAINFDKRGDVGKLENEFNDHILTPESLPTPPMEPRIKLKANTDMGKFTYKTMAMKLSESSEILDERIDLFMDLVQVRHKLEDQDFGDPATQSTSEIVTVGRIASDTSNAKLQKANLLLETSRRAGRGRRVPLDVSSIKHYEFFPGQIVALRGQNASGDYFTVKEILSLPWLDPPASIPQDLVSLSTRLQTSIPDSDTAHPLTVLIAAGPYSTNDTLDFSPLRALCEIALSASADALILHGPFIDAEHPLVRTGSFTLPDDFPVSPDTATLSDLFRYHISTALTDLTSNLPSCSIILVPSVRDAVSHHTCWPQDRLPKRDLGLGKGVQSVTNPVTLSFNEFVVGMTSLDVLYTIRREECISEAAKTIDKGATMRRLAKQLIDQRSFFPIVPPTDREALAPMEGVKIAKGTNIKSESEEPVEGQEDEPGAEYLAPFGASLDVGYLKLGEWQNVRPDLLLAPSALDPCTVVVENVMVINPGTLAKRKGFGTYARMTILPRDVSDEELERGEMVGHKLFERAKVEIIKI
ncbi:DNA polymerase alpha/primase associated subunit [Patellaria atrata CBS 101060]|uniref:DNA polymerase alpha subunit B n=1 Tax=Patellaria atrata CBS 101060 TaxID=1346257 RepID=A0A9P4S8I7_9PEZI|nr:DNA polymerase alpha/primase associated subunit [Patellaria atrata CBS 101060]